MFARLKAGQVNAVAIGINNIYPGVAKASGKWVRLYDITEGNTVLERLKDILDIHNGDEPPEESAKKLTKAQRGERRFEYKSIIESEHWAKIAARIKTETDELAVQDWLLAAKELDKDEDSGIVKAINQKLEEMRMSR